jgi:hypothetical protein
VDAPPDDCPAEQRDQDEDDEARLRDGLAGERRHGSQGWKGE